jgi:glycine cleavage system H protein
VDLNTLRYAPTHEWAHRDPHGDTVTVGITAFAAEQLGDVTYLELPKVGKSFSAGDEVGVIESVKSTSPLYAPVSGEVIAVNDPLVNDLERLRDDPYEKGWMYKVRLAPGATLDHLLTKTRYDEQIASEGH